MKHYQLACLGIVVAITGGCLPDKEPDSITVSGSATIEVMPDTFEVSGKLYESNRDRDALVAAISEANETILDNLGGVEGLTGFSVETSSLDVAPVRDLECVKAARYDYEDQCPVVSYTASIGYEVTGSPADKAGNLVAALAELGAEESEVTGYLLSDNEQAKERAQIAAVENATRQAQSIAKGAGARIGRVIKIQSGDGLNKPEELMLFERDSDSIVVTGFRVRREISVRPGPIDFSSEVTIEFEIIQDTE